LRHALLWSLLLVSLKAFALSADEARHLLVRTGFDASADAVAQLAPLSHQNAVKKILGGTHTDPVTPAPAWVNDPPPDPRRLRDLDDASRKQLQQQLRERALELKGWWYREMIATDSPLTERMTLFWHNHFTSSLRKVKWPAALYRQNLLLRQHALGNFGTLLHAIARDPAMLIYLDGQQNRRDKPNENFARELLELFTLGEGHYAERDIKEAARAFTGWMVDRRDGRFIVNPRQHDGGEKTFLGARGTFDGDDILRIVLAHPRTAEYITEKLWHEFVSDTPDPTEVERLAGIFRQASYELHPLLQALFSTAAFRDPRNRGTLVKSPVDLVIGTVRQFDIPIAEERNLVRAGIVLGQDLFDPPNVKGWPGGTTWITSSTLLTRNQILERLLRGAEMGPTRRAVAAMQEPDAALKQLLLPLEPVNPLPAGGGTVALRAWLLDPVYQLK
jgi:uncharacterized protein (DUF1800 family)